MFGRSLHSEIMKVVIIFQQKSKFYDWFDQGCLMKELLVRFGEVFH